MSDILIFGYNKWCYPRPSNNIAEELSIYHRVLFVECQSRYSELGFKNFYRYIKAFCPQKPKRLKANFYIWDPPPMLPLEWVKKLGGTDFIISIVLRFTKHMENKYLKKAMKRVSFTPKAVFIFDSHDLIHLIHLQYVVSIYWVYDEIDKFPINTAVKNVLPGLEKNMIGLADHVLASSFSQYKKRETWNKKTVFFPNASSYELFNRAVSKKFDKPQEFKHLKGQIIGAIGIFDRRLDVALIKEVSIRCMHINFIFIGPVREYMLEQVQMLKCLKNIHFLPVKPHSELPAYIDYFDICWIPYIVNESTNTMFLSKVHEYLSTGKPILSTPLYEMKRLGNLMYFSNDAESTVASIENILKDDPSYLKEKRIHYANENSFEKQVHFIQQLIGEKS